MILLYCYYLIYRIIVYDRIVYIWPKTLTLFLICLIYRYCWNFELCMWFISCPCPFYSSINSSIYVWTMFFLTYFILFILFIYFFFYFYLHFGVFFWIKPTIFMIDCSRNWNMSSYLLLKYMLMMWIYFDFLDLK